MESIAQNRPTENTRPYVTEDHEFDYWSKEFGISRDELAAAVKAGESYTAAVEKYVKTLKLTA